MAWITPKTKAIWESGQFIGENTPTAVVQIQLGQWRRGWNTWADNPNPNGFQPKIPASIYWEGGYTVGGQAGYWSGAWFPDTGLYTLPNLSNIKRTRDVSQNGVTVLEVVIDAQDYVPKVGALGDAYHALAPGWLAPTRNYVAPGRAIQPWQQPDQLSDQWAPDGALGRITDSVMIRVWQGYGPPETAGGHTPPIDGGSNGAWMFRGMVDDVDLDGDPNTITITARNGKLLTDQRTFRASKSPQLKDPITFYDRQAALVQVLIGSGANASSTADTDHPALNVLDQPHQMWDIADTAYSTEWRSANSIDSSNLEWVEIRLPQGHYEDFWMVSDAGRECYVGIYAQPILHWEPSDTGGAGIAPNVNPPTMDGDAIAEGWVDLGPTAPGGGWQYIRTFTTGSTLPNSTADGDPVIDRPSLQHKFELGQHSILRVGFTKSGAAAPMKVQDLHGIRRVVDKEIAKQQFILVDDASDVVRVVLRWAGYDSWNVEQAGVRLSDGTNFGPGVVQTPASGRLIFNRTQTLVEIIQSIGKQLGFIFFIADPIDSESDGVPTFRRDSSLLTDKNYIAAELTDATMLTGLKVKHSDESKPAVIRVRGKTVAARGGGVPLGWDSVTRIMAVYFPPWWFGSRSGGVLRHIVYQDDQLITFAQCVFGAMLTALNAAVAMHTAVAEIPAHPLLELDNQVSVIDEATATNSRLWIVKTEDTMALGQNASWKMTLEGSLIDSQDFHDVLDQILGNAPITLGGPGTTQIVIDSINWRRVTDPFTGKDTGYIPPTGSWFGTGAGRSDQLR